MGRDVEVYFNPSDHADAVLETGLIGRDLLMVIYWTPINALVLANWMYVWPVWRHRATGGVRLTERGSVQRLQSADPWRPIHFAIMAAIGMGGSLTFFLIAFTDQAVSMRAAVGMVLALSAVVVAAAILRAVRWPAERGELVIDWVKDSLTIPVLEKRKKPLRVPVSSLSEFRAETDGAVGAEDVAFYAVAVVNWGNCVATLERVSDGRSEWSARTLTNWLNDQLSRRRAKTAWT